MRSSIALILSGAAIAFVASAAPSLAGGTQLCRPTGTSPMIWVCDSGGFENSVAYSTANYGPNVMSKGHDCSYNPAYSGGPARSAASTSQGAAAAGDGAASSGDAGAAAAAAGPSG
jgi:hypothetical protein